TAGGCVGRAPEPERRRRQNMPQRGHPMTKTSTPKQLKEYECSGVRLTNKADQNSRKKHQGRLTQARASHDLASALSYSALHYELNLDLAIAQHGGSNWSGALSSLDRREHGLGI